MRGPDHIQCDCLKDDSWVSLLEVGDNGIPIVCYLCLLQQVWELKRDRLVARLVREDLEAGSVGEASSVSEELGISLSRPHHSSGVSVVDWAISQPTLLPVVMQFLLPV